METKFNFNSQICTTKEQSERLLTLGLKKETADMFYAAIHNGTKIVGYRISPGYNDEHFEIFTDDIPAWSLHRLWELLGKIKKYEGEDGLLYPRISLVEEDVTFDCPASIRATRNFCSPKGVYENIIDCIELLIKEGYFNKEYLNGTTKD